MQLTSKASIKKKLKVATCTLLTATAVNASDVQSVEVKETPKKSFFGKALETVSEKLKKWEFDVGLLFYKEPERVQAVEPAIQARREFGDEKFLTLKLVVDTLTGASHNGASPSSKVQTFTTPSGSATYTANANEAPLDSTFKDTRIALSTSWEQPLARNWKGSVGASASNEYDYFSSGINGSIAKDLNQKNTTISLGLGVFYDTIKPVGDIPTPLATMVSPGVTQPRGESSDTKTIIDTVLGMTQVINRRTLMQFNYSLSASSGYLTDPYKVISVIDATNGATLGDASSFIYEKRPESRTKHSLYWLTKHHLSGDTIDFSYRYMWDDWEIKSHTFDLRYRWRFSKQKRYLEPRVRYYSQTEAEFYKTSIRSTTSTPEFLSADYRLGDMDAITLGLKYGQDLDNGHSWSLRLEYYLQTGNALPDGGAIGSQVGVDLYPDVDAVIAQAIYSF